MKLMILDGNSIVNRAYYGVRMLNAPDGTPTNAVYGFLAILQRLLDANSPDALCVAFDLPAPTFRHRQYALYKAQRKPMPDDLAVQMPLLKDVLSAMGIKQLSAEGWEADDVLGTVAKLCEADGWDCEIVTGDRDSFQLITEKTDVLHVKTAKGQTETIDYDLKRFNDEYGFAPPLMVDLKALMGDASDNIPGVAGIGEKTALDLIRRFGTIESIYSNLDTLDIKDSVRKKLSAGEESARMSYELATISREAPVELRPADAAWNMENRPELYAALSRLGFRRFIDKWGLTPGESDTGSGEEASGVRVLPEKEISVSELTGRIAQADYVSVLYGEDISDLTICDGEGIYSVSQLTAGEEWDAFTDTLFSDRVRKVSHGVKDFMGHALAANITPRGFIFDTELAAYVLDPTESAYPVDRLAARHLGGECPTAQAVYELYPVLDAKLSEAGGRDLYYNIELPLCAVLDTVTGRLRLRRQHGERHKRAAGGDLALCRARVQHQLAQAAGRSAL